MVLRCKFLVLALCLLLPNRVPAPILSGPIMRTIGGSSSTLNTGLIAYWKLDETSGTRNDSYSTNHLTDNNTVASATGIIGNAADFEDVNTEYLNKTGNWASQTSDFTISAWVNLESLESGQSFGSGIMRNSNSDAVGDWIISIGGVSPYGAVNLYHWTSSGVDSDGRITTAEDNIITAGTWFHILCRRSSSVYTIWVNGSSRSLDAGVSTSSGWGNVGFEMGRMFTQAAYYNDGLIDEASIWSRALSDTEITELYNSGAGKTCCPFP